MRPEPLPPPESGHFSPHPDGVEFAPAQNIAGFHAPFGLLQSLSDDGPLLPCRGRPIPFNRRPFFGRELVVCERPGPVRRARASCAPLVFVRIRQAPSRSPYALDLRLGEESRYFPAASRQLQHQIVKILASSGRSGDFASCELH